MQIKQSVDDYQLADFYWKQTSRLTAIALWQQKMSNKKFCMKFAIERYLLHWNGLYCIPHLLRKCSFYVFALLSSIGKLLWGVFNRCLPQTVHYKFIISKSLWGKHATRLCNDISNKKTKQKSLYLKFSYFLGTRFALVTAINKNVKTFFFLNISIFHTL